jgi:ribonuclease P protein component
VQPRAGRHGQPASGALTALQVKGRFRPSSRVRKRREYLEIQARGLRVGLAHFVLIFVARSEAARVEPRLGVTASRKIGGAVQRNRAKRLVKEAFRAMRPLFPADIDLVVIVRSGLEELKLADVVREWEAARPQIARRIDAARRARAASENERDGVPASKPEA